MRTRAGCLSGPKPGNSTRTGQRALKFHLPTELATALEDLARKESRSISNLCRQAVVEFLDSARPTRSLTWPATTPMTLIRYYLPFDVADRLRGAAIGGGVKLKDIAACAVMERLGNKRRK